MVSPAELKQIAGHDFFFASTIKSPFKDVDFAEKVMKKLKEKYEKIESHNQLWHSWFDVYKYFDYIFPFEFGKIKLI